MTCCHAKLHRREECVGVCARVPVSMCAGAEGGVDVDLFASVFITNTDGSGVFDRNIKAERRRLGKLKWRGVDNVTL